MARVHLFTSSTQPYNYKRGPENNIAQEPLLSSDDIIDNTTISEQPLDIGTSCAFATAPSSPEHHLSSTALTAALLANNELTPIHAGKHMKKRLTLSFFFAY
jgi:hypothetical protein